MARRPTSSGDGRPAERGAGRTVLVTGVARQLGARLARSLAADARVDRVVGVDLVEPPYDIGGAEFVLTDIRRPDLTQLLDRVQPDTVVHMNVLTTPLDAGGRAPQKEINVIGTMQLLGACQKAASLRTLVVKSSATVYGSSPRDPAQFKEEMVARSVPRSGYAKDSLEVEGYVRGFARRRPDVDVTTLRFANFMGPTVNTPMTAYFLMPVVPTVLGYDPRLQFVHEDDGMEALQRATVERWSGTYNVAGDGVVLLSQAIRRAGRVELGVPRQASGVVGDVFRRLGLADFSPEQLRLLTYGRGIDTSRVRQERGFVAKHTSEEAFDQFVAARARGGILDNAKVVAAERLVLSALHGAPVDVPAGAGSGGG
jgi:UDP-glucose 4-epimerase